MSWVWIDDGLVARGDATVSAFDLGFRSGLGVFETLRIREARLPPTWESHLNRARGGAVVLGFHLPPAASVTGAATTLLEMDGRSEVVLRATFSAGQLQPDPFPGRSLGQPTMVLTLQEPPEATPAVTAVTLGAQRGLPEIKSTSYADAALAHLTASRAGADDALLVADGCVLEGASSTVFALIDGVLVTPPTDRALAGVTRQWVLDHAAELDLGSRVAHLPVADLMAADEVWLTSAVRGVRSLVKVDGTPIRSGRPGPAARAAHLAWEKMLAQ